MPFYMNQYDLGVSFLFACSFPFWVLVSFLGVSFLFGVLVSFFRGVLVSFLLVLVSLSGCYPRDGGLYKTRALGPGPMGPGHLAL